MFQAIQGEGAVLGMRTFFVRFGLCDYRCAWCDSMHAVDPAQVRAHADYMTQEEIAHYVVDATQPGDWVTYSGGNPALHDLTMLTRLLQLAGRSVQVETQGSFYRTWLRSVDQLTVSPKPPSSGMETDYLMLTRLLRLVTKDQRIPGDIVTLKVVVGDEVDYAYAADIHHRFPSLPMYLSVLNAYPNGVALSIRPELEQEIDAVRLACCDRLAWLTDRVLNDPVPGMRDVIITTQQHVLAFGNKKGV